MPPTTRSMRPARIRRRVAARKFIKILPPVAITKQGSVAAVADAIRGSRLQANASSRLAGYFKHGDSFGPVHCRYAAISAALGGDRLDFLRLGRAALFHADHDLRVCPLF